MTKIVRLEAENIKRLKAVAIEPGDDPVVVISGRNAAGKSSVLDAIALALAGGEATKLTTRPIRDGETSAHVTLDLGDFTVTRTWEEGKPSVLKVMSKDGARYGKPQNFLNEKLGALSFDPLTFTTMEPKKQLATLLALVDLPFDPAEVAARRLGIYEERTEVGRRVKVLQGALDGVDRPSGAIPVETSAAEAVDAYAAAQGQHVEYQALWDRTDAAAKELAELEARAEALKATLVSFNRQMLKMGDLPDLDALKASLDTVEERNEGIRAQKVDAERWGLLDANVAHYKKLTAALDQLDADKGNALSEAKMPIDGLAFDEEGVTYQGLPFAQASAAEQLRVSLAMALAMNPDIRVVRITDGSLLDGANMELVAKMAAEAGAQVWLERVSDEGEVGVVIEDGAVKEA